VVDTLVLARRKHAGGLTLASLLECLSRSRLGRIEAFNGPAFWNDPSPCFAGGDEQHFNASLSTEAVGQRSKLNTSRSVHF
jgi:hypothetical protein